MYTSYFNNIKNVKNPLSICGKAPDWYSGPQYKILAPKYWFLIKYKNKELTKDDYIKHYYNEILNNLDPTILYKKLIRNFGENVTLLCYEKPNEFCHRHIVREWFQNNGINIQEL